MAKYRKKPVEIEAFQYDGDFMNKDGDYYVPEWAVNAKLEGVLYFKDGELYIKTLEGVHHARVGDYIIKGVKGEIYPCKPEIFEMTYEAVEERKDCGSKNNVELNAISIMCDGEEITIGTPVRIEDVAEAVHNSIEAGVNITFIEDCFSESKIYFDPHKISSIKYDVF